MNIDELVITRVQVEKEISGRVSGQMIWKILSDFERYPELMDNVVSVRVFEQDGSPYSEWHVEVEGAPLTWTEKDVPDETNRRIRFEAVEGDLYLFQGSWQISGAPPALKICFQANYSLGLPTVEQALGHILRDKLHANIRQMLDALCEQVSYGSS